MQDERKCPMALHSVSSSIAAIPSSTSPSLLRFSEVTARYTPCSPMGGVLTWVHSFLAAPHSDLGRKGSVCPFVPMSIDLDMIWMAEVSTPNPSVNYIKSIVSEYRDLFLTTEPTNPADSINKAFMVVFPNLDADGASMVDEVQSQLKMDFVDMGLMLGEFHAKNEGEGLRNAGFRPLRSPTPILAIRHMVDSDLPFLLRADYPASKRANFLRSYLTRLQGSLSRSKFEAALNGVIDAEIEKWMAKAAENSAPVASALLCPNCNNIDGGQVKA